MKQRQHRMIARIISLASLGAIALPALAQPDRPRSDAPQYVAVGDSYGSGTGLYPQSNATCGRYEANAPAILGQLQGWSVDDRSCAGATVEFGFFRPWYEQPAQMKAIQSETQYVSVHFGGNDTSFSRLLWNCDLRQQTERIEHGSPCKDWYEAGDFPIQLDLDGLQPWLVQAMASIRQRSPHAKVVLVGYPAIFPEDSNQCLWNNRLDYAGLFTQDDITWFRELQKSINRILKETAEQNGAGYADLYAHFQGHDVCQKNGLRWIASINPTGTVPPEGNDPWAALHPTRAGHFQVAMVLRTAFGALNSPLNRSSI
ncbi:MAG TPA: SGNH/GDSL hydrolase family protein [Dyella sp.]|uniref:SGNH/GDSL hydrolase family protein n=1 Tax=Dyella sp. TaxID=1869338 RepID=UPI002F91EF08